MLISIIKKPNNMKNILLLLLILTIAPFSLKAKNIKHGKEIKFKN